MDSTETTQRISMKLGDREDLSPEWCSKPVFFVFFVRNITQPCILYLTYAILHNSAMSFIYHSRVIYITQSYLKHTLKLKKKFL